MNVNDLIASGAITEQKTGGVSDLHKDTGGAALTVARPLTPEEQKVWEKYKGDLQRGKAEPVARKGG